MMGYFKRIKDILTYYDYEPLIFFVALYDFFDVGVLILGFDEYGGGSNFFQTFNPLSFGAWDLLLYWIGAILILLTLNNKKWLERIITIHAIQATIYFVNMYILDKGDVFKDFFNDWQSYQWIMDLTAQLFWGIAWIWILFQMKKKELYRKIGL